MGRGTRKVFGGVFLVMAALMLLESIGYKTLYEAAFGGVHVVFLAALGLFFIYKKDETPVLRKIGGGFLLYVAVFLVFMEGLRIDVVIASLFFAVPGLVLMLKRGKTPEEKAERKAKLEALKAEIKVEKERKKEIESRTVFTEHTAGLPLGEGISCSVRFDEKCVTIDSSGVSFHIAYKKMTDMRVTTSTEIKKYYVSDVGGAIAGNAAFGPLGALLFGGAQERTDTEVKRFLMFTYINAKTGKLDYAAFQIPRKLDQMKAKELIGKYRFKAASGGMSIEL